MDRCVYLCLNAILLLLLFVKELLSTKQAGFIGCFEDQIGNIFPGNNFPKTVQPTEAVAVCIAFCRKSTDKYTGVKYHTNYLHCYCGNITESNKQETDCTVSCPGSKSDMCAGAQAIGLYETFDKRWDNEDDDSDDQDTEDDIVDDNSNTIYISVSIVITVGLLIAFAVFLFFWYKREKMKSISQTDNGDGEMRQRTVEDQSPPNNSTSNTHMTRSSISNYAEISPEGLQNSRTDSYVYIGEMSQRQELSSHEYDILGLQTHPAKTACSNYSHLTGDYKKQKTTADDAYSHTENFNDKRRLQMSTSSNDTDYNKLQRNANTNFVNSDNPDDTEYNHAKAGGKDTKMFVVDEYSHLDTVQLTSHLDTDQLTSGVGDSGPDS